MDRVVLERGPLYDFSLIKKKKKSSLPYFKGMTLNSVVCTKDLFAGLHKRGTTQMPANILSAGKNNTPTTIPFVEAKRI